MFRCVRMCDPGFLQLSRSGSNPSFNLCSLWTTGSRPWCDQRQTGDAFCIKGKKNVLKALCRFFSSYFKGRGHVHHCSQGLFKAYSLECCPQTLNSSLGPLGSDYRLTGSSAGGRGRKSSGLRSEQVLQALGVGYEALSQAQPYCTAPLGRSSSDLSDCEAIAIVS